MLKMHGRRLGLRAAARPALHLLQHTQHTQRLIKRLYAKTSGYKFPWPYIAEYHDPLDSGDPRLENPEFRKSLEKMTMQHRSKEEAEVAERSKEQQDQTEVMQALFSLAADFETKVQAEMEAEKARPLDRVVTAEVRQTAKDFAIAWNELLALESAVLEFSGTNFSLDSLKPYLASGKYEFSGINPKAVAADADSRIRLLADNLCNWYENRAAEVYVPPLQFNMVLDNIATSTQISGDWMTAYAVELGNPGSKAKEIFDRVASVDPELYKAREHAAELAVLEERDQTHRALTAHMTKDRRAVWYKEHQQREQTAIAKLETSFHPDSIQLFKTRSERQDIRESARPIWERAPFPIYGKQMTDDPIETAFFTLVGDMLRRKKSDDELALLQESVNSFEDLIRFHALHAESSRRFMSKPDAQIFLNARETLRDALSQKFRTVEQLGMRLELFRKHPHVLRCLSAAVGNWLLYLDFAFWRALPYKQSDVSRIELHMAECYMNGRMAIRKAYSLLSLPQFGGSEMIYIPQDLPSETPYGVNPTELAFKSPPSAYVDPKTNKFKYQGALIEADPYPTPKFVQDSTKLESLISEENRRKEYLFWLAVLVAALAVYYWITTQSQLAAAWNDSRTRWTRFSLQKAVSIFGTLDTILYWISYPLNSDGLDHLRSLTAPLFAVYDRSDADFRHTREQAVSILLNKRDLERRIFKADVMRAIRPLDFKRINAVGSGQVDYLAKRALARASYTMSASISAAFDSSVRTALRSCLVALRVASAPAARFRVWYSQSMLLLRSGTIKLQNQFYNLLNQRV
eukprot:TRINITY_DN13656_c0_g1_i1.p1 TRINITY_DN13656_c0_g1~~TRINITY_DN13656_c0_g1_i1.p1  ORF type:complete len:804 (-),score=116.09 TRINITY_DN13656_c0_g1_i1:57-2468(-)